MKKKKEMKAALAEISSKIDDIDLNTCRYVIWGAGNTASLCQESFRRHNIDPLCYIDGNVEKQKTLFHGHRVRSPDDIDSMGGPLVLISSGNVGFTEEIRTKLNKKGLRNITVDEYFFGKNADRLIRIADMLHDAESVNVFCSMILNRLNNKFPDAGIISDNPYFILPNFRKISAGDVFVNMGAYIGEEIEKYLEYCDGKDFGKIISFEPDANNFAELKSLVKKMNKKWNIEEGKIQNVMAAVSDATKTSSFRSGQGPHSSIGDSDIDGSSVNVYALDDFMPNGKIDLLKADIESFELKMLHGARNVIRRNAPKIAVCIYHSPADYFDIIDYLDGLNIGYKFSVRHHLDTFSETILYAYTEEK